SRIMNSSLLVVLLFVAAASAQTWGPWTPAAGATCSDDCGYCGLKLTMTRTCDVPGKCSGVAQMYEECGAKMCRFPKKTCCPGYEKGQLPNGAGFECVAKAIIPLRKRMI
ncbi:hypothetical protein PMAYCL1PPCAC_13256, partial [Pristionchus mayeri]